MATASGHGAAWAQGIDPEADREATVPTDVPKVTTVADTVVPAPDNSLWDQKNVQDLLAVVDAIGGEGLTPRHYEGDALRKAIATGDAAQYGPMATKIYLRLAHDMQYGSAPPEARLDWHMDMPGGDPNAEMTALNTALATHSVRATLEALPPNHPQYLALKRMLAATPASNKVQIDRLRVSLERWRWMPRSFGNDYIFVNVPAYNVALVSGTRAVARHKVVVGKPTTPTPQLFVPATGVILNPTWTVPQSIVKNEMGNMVRNPRAAKARGFTVTKSATGTVNIVQGPGAGNALGMMKLVMTNPYAIYLHDTPSKSFFAQKQRDLSHGCIRTEKAPLWVAAMLREVPGYGVPDIGKIVASGKTTKVDLPRPVNVLITYLTAVAEDNGTLKTYEDIYGRDVPVIQALNRAVYTIPPVAKPAPAPTPAAPAVTLPAPTPATPAPAAAPAVNPSPDFTVDLPAADPKTPPKKK